MLLPRHCDSGRFDPLEGQEEEEAVPEDLLRARGFGVVIIIIGKH